MTKKNANPVDELLPLSLSVFHMLLALSDGERHGYALKREVLHRTNGKLNLGSGALYGSISKMLDQALIEESETGNYQTVERNGRPCLCMVRPEI